MGQLYTFVALPPAARNMFVALPLSPVVIYTNRAVLLRATFYKNEEILILELLPFSTDRCFKPLKLTYIFVTI